MTFTDDYQERLKPWSDIKDEMPLIYGFAHGYQKGRFLELGVRTGNSTSAFLAACSRTGGHLWSVDVNEPSVPAHWEGSGYWTFEQCDDLDWVPPDDARFDVVFIDTSHEFTHTLAELRRFVPLVAPGGMVLLHDIRLEDAHGRHQVTDAIDQFCREYWLVRNADGKLTGNRVELGSLPWEKLGGRYGLGLIRHPNG